MGCGSSNVHVIVVIHSTDPLQEPTTELNSVPDTLDGYPVPRPSHNRKSDVLQFLNFKEVDDDARNVGNQTCISFHV